MFDPPQQESAISETDYAERDEEDKEDERS